MGQLRIEIEKEFGRANNALKDLFNNKDIPDHVKSALLTRLINIATEYKNILEPEYSHPH